MDKVLQINNKDFYCTVQAGLGYIRLNEILSVATPSDAELGHGHKLWFPLDPRLGANIGTN